MSGTTGTNGGDNLNGGSGADIIDGGAGNDKISGGSGSDILDGGSGSDVVNGDSGNDTLIYNLSENLNGSKDIYTGGSGIDTVLLELTQAQWTDSAVRAQLQNYVQFLVTVKTNTQGEVSNGSASDFVFTFANGTTLTVQMMEKLAISVQSTPGGPYVPIDYLAALITGPATGTVGEAGGVNNAIAGTPTASGDLYADDLNGAADVFQVVAAGAATANGYGTYGVTANGVWTFTLNNANASVQGLNVGGTLTDTFTVLAADGSSKVVTITINGANDAAVITGTSSGTVVEAGGVANGTPGTPTTTGDLLATDVDNAADAFQPVVAGAVTANGYGTYGVTASGVWTYTLNNSNGNVQALDVGESLSDDFTVYSADGTAQIVNITISGADDQPTLAAVSSGSVAEVRLSGSTTDSGLSGTLGGADVDVETLSYGISGGTDNGDGTVSKTLAYGTLTVNTTTGAYSYAKNAGAIEALDDGENFSDVFTVTVSDGDDAAVTQTYTVNVSGADDQPTLAAVSSGSITEVTLSSSTVDSGLTGTLAGADVDVETLTYGIQGGTVGSGVSTLAGAYGTLTVDTSTGVYSYAKNAAAVEALGAGATATDIFTMTVTDGDDAPVTRTYAINLAGADDAPVLSDTTDPAAVPELGNASAQNLAPISDSFSVTDVDVGDTLTASVVGSPVVKLNGGAFTLPVGASALTATGVFSLTNAVQASTGGALSVNYTYDPASANLDFLRAIDTLTITYSVKINDGFVDSATQDVTFTITGTNDAPVIQLVTTDSAAASLTETNAGLSTSGTLTVTDVDLTDTVNSSVTTVAASGITTGLALSNAQLLGLLSVTPVSGLPADTGDTHNLTWTFDSATQPQAFDYLAPGQSLTLAYTVQSSDNDAASDTQTVTITINGTNDGPTAVTDNVITNVGTGTNFMVPEWALLANDVDPDGGGALDVSGVGGASGVTVSHSAGIGTNGLVTINDTPPAGGSFTYQATDATTVGTPGTVNVTQDTVGTLDGTAGNDILVSANAGTTLVGGTGNDIMFGGSGNDTYRFGLSDGSDVIRDSGSGGDKIEIVTAGPGDATVISTLNFERVGTDLVINVGSTQITIDDHYVGAGKVESIQFTPGGTAYGYVLSSGAYQISTDSSTPLSEGGGSDVIASSSGIETLNGGNGNDLLFGNGGADTINGEGGADLLVGGAGLDNLNGGSGNDVLVGGLDADTFIFSTALNASTNVDKVQDFSANGVDLLQLSNGPFGLGSSGTLADADFASVASGGATASVGAGVNVIYDSSTGNLYFDSDGGSSGNRMLFATVAINDGGLFDNNDVKLGT